MGESSATAIQSVPSDRPMEAFRSTLRGSAISPSDDSCGPARRVYNAMIDRRPRLIVQCADVADVIRCVRFAREEGLTLAVRCGGHSVAGFGTCDDGLVIDLSRMKGIHVDPAKGVARVEGGCTWGDFDHASHVFGLATPGGIISTTGVGGLVLGGGFGYLTRQFGLACDNLISADVVTADGNLLKAGAGENPDLFWAIRGGGGNFGIVTSFEFRLHRVSTVYAGPVLYSLEKGAEVMRWFDSFMAVAPRALSAFFAYLIVPSGPPFPEWLHGKTMCGIVYVWSGHPDKGEQATRALREFARPAFSLGRWYRTPPRRACLMPFFLTASITSGKPITMPVSATTLSPRISVSVLEFRLCNPPCTCIRWTGRFTTYPRTKRHSSGGTCDLPIFSPR